VEKELLSKMFTAVQKCLTIGEKIKFVEYINNTMIYDVLLSNLIVIRDIEKKISQDLKQKISAIDWEKFEDYDKEITNKFEHKDSEVIYKIIKEELPNIQIELEKILFSE
jgi:uncharacterized protein with HEPN domain